MNQKEPVDGQQATVAGLSGQSKAHLCAASNIRAMPETEIPPANAGYHKEVYGIGVMGEKRRIVADDSASIRLFFCFYQTA